MKQPQKKRRPRKTYTVREVFVLYGKERTVLHEIFKETVLKCRRCAQLSLSDLSKGTGLSRSTVAYQLEKLQEKRMIDIEKTQRTQTICINMVYKEVVDRRMPT
jgi:predicted transcriptional regulator